MKGIFPMSWGEINYKWLFWSPRVCAEDSVRLSLAMTETFKSLNNPYTFILWAPILCYTGGSLGALYWLTSLRPEFRALLRHPGADVLLLTCTMPVRSRYTPVSRCVSLWTLPQAYLIVLLLGKAHCYGS